MKDEDWYLLCVRPTYEDEAKRMIEMHAPGSTVYFPVARVSNVLKHGEEPELKPPFQGFVWARMPTKPNFDKINAYCKSKPRYMVFGDNPPLWVRNCEVEKLREREAQGWCMKDSDVNSSLSEVIGRGVRILTGEFKWHYGRIHEVTNKGVFVVRFWMFNRAIFPKYCAEDLDILSAKETEKRKNILDNIREYPNKQQRQQIAESRPALTNDPETAGDCGAAAS